MNEMSVKVIFDSQLSYLPILRKAVRGICSTFVNDDKCLEDIDLCLNEAVGNVIYHAYQNEPGHEIQVVVTLYKHEITIQVIDHGMPNPHPDKPVEINKFEDIASISETGRGMFLIHTLMDEVQYKTESGNNILLLRKCCK